MKTKEEFIIVRFDDNKGDFIVRRDLIINGKVLDSLGILEKQEYKIIKIKEI